MQLVLLLMFLVEIRKTEAPSFLPLFRISLLQRLRLVLRRRFAVFPLHFGATQPHSIFLLLFPHTHTHIHTGARVAIPTHSQDSCSSASLPLPSWTFLCCRRFVLFCSLQSAVWLGISVAHLERCEVGAWISARREFRTRDRHFASQFFPKFPSRYRYPKLGSRVPSYNENPSNISTGLGIRQELGRASHYVTRNTEVNSKFMQYIVIVKPECKC